MTRHFGFGDQQLTPSEVQLWLVALAAPSEGVEARAALLSEDERARAARFHFERHRTRFILARAALREILSGYLGIPPEAVRFRYGARGKPGLDPSGTGPDGAGLQFNLSHSAHLALVGVTRDRRIGVDVEAVRPLSDLEALARTCFTARERALLDEAAPAARPELFFTLWTRKEAFIKALGTGLACPLTDVDVSSLAAGPVFALGRDGPHPRGHPHPQPLSRARERGASSIASESVGPAAPLAGRPAASQRRPSPYEHAAHGAWTICDVDVAAGFRAAAALEGNDCRLVLQNWPDHHR